MRARVLLLLLGSCVNVSQQYRCAPGDNAACVDDNGTQGRCEASGNCSFPDATCGNEGFRYDTSADPGRVDICVLSSAGVDITQPQTVGSTHSLLFEITTPPQMIVFDTEAPGTDTLVSLHWFMGTCPPSGTEQATFPEGCQSPTASRISVAASAPGPYCLVAMDDPSISLAHIALRVFPSATGTPPSCER